MLTTEERIKKEVTELLISYFPQMKKYRERINVLENYLSKDRKSLNADDIFELIELRSKYSILLEILERFERYLSNTEDTNIKKDGKVIHIGFKK